MTTAKKGFTLIELLIVIGILAILATAAILVLNPARLFAEARDSQRISDFTAIKNALELYLATVSTPSVGGSACGTTWWATLDALPATSQPFATPATAGISATLGATTLKTDGTGWVRVSLDSMTDGSPLAALPKDPRNTGTAALDAATSGMYYAYQCTPDTGSNNLKYEMNTRMESARYANTGGDDVESKDGGNKVDIYEVGNDPGLNL